MDGALRIGAWVALVLGIHAAPALSVPLWEAPAWEPAIQIVIRVNQRPRWQTATEAVTHSIAARRTRGMRTCGPLKRRRPRS